MRQRPPRRSGPLVVGLGNPFGGDAGVGLRILELLALEKKLPEEVTLTPSTPEFPRQQDLWRDRREVVFLDAFLAEPVGRVLEWGDAELRAADPLGEEVGRPLSAPNALAQLREVGAALVEARFRVVGVAIGTRGTMRVRAGLSPAVEKGARRAARRVLDILRRSAMQ